MKDLSPQARQLLEVARDGDTPTTADRARVRRALAATLAAGGVSTSASAAAATKTALSGSAKSGVGLWLALGAATGVVTSAIVFVAAPAWKAHRAPSAGQAVTRTAAAPSAPPTPSVAEPSPAAITPAAHGEPAHGSTTALAASEPAPESTTALAARAPSASTPIAAQGSPHKNKRAPEGSSTDTTSPAARAEAAAESGSSSSAVPPAAAPTSPAVPSSLGAETALLENARAALGRGDAAGALSLLDEHERDFPRGVLVEERLATRVFALCSLGRKTEAQGVAERLLRHSPSSPLRARVLQSCAGPR